MKFVAALLTLSATLLLATPTLGKTQSGFSENARKWRASMGLSAFSLGSANTDNQGLGESAFGVDIAGNYYFSPKLVTSLGFGVLNIKDNEKFSQDVTVTNLFGSNNERAKSSVTTFPLFAELSYRSLAARSSGYGYSVGAGLTHFAGTERSISSCIGCRSDELTIDGGAYLTAGAFYNKSRSSKFGISARQYISGDVKASILLWLEIK